MSYCVNCGVELDDSAVKCALCSTPVINPNKKKGPSDEKPFSDTVQIPKAVKKRFAAFVATIAMFIPTVVTFFMNVFFIRKGFWSIYVFGTVVLIWTVFILPFFLKKKNPYIMLAADTVVSFVYCFVVIGLHSDEINILYAVLSLILSVSLAVLIFIIWGRHHKRHWSAVIIMILSEFTAVSLISSFLFTVFLNNINFFVIGAVCSVCSLVLTLFFIYCNKSRHVKAWLNKVFYI